MLDAEYLLFCAGKSVDDNGNLSLHGIFDRLYVRQFPTSHHPFKAVCKLSAKKAVVEKELAMRVTLNLKNKELAAIEGVIKTTVEKGNALVPDIDLAQFVFPEPGVYTLSVSLDEKQLISRDLQVFAVDELTEN
jgi:hypothetical protein